MANAQSQSGNAYEFLDLPTTSRSVALGGRHAAIGTDEAGFFFQNPSVLCDTLHNSIAFNITPMPADMVHGSLMYAHNIKGIGTFAAGVQYISYGEFERTDEYGNDLGTFGANETAIYLAYSRPMSRGLHIGATIKPIFSKLDDYSSFGIAMDMGATYRSANGRFRASAVIRNVGAQVTTYLDDSQHESLNTDMRIGIAYKPEHAPFRFTLTLKDLFHWDLSTGRNKINAGDNIMRHVVAGAEFLPFRNFFVGFGYDHRARKECRTSDTGGAAGLSWGFGLRLFRIDIAYACGKYHIAGAANSISLSTNFNRFM